MDTDYLARATEWSKRAESERDPFVKFILLFIALEVLIGLKEMDKVWRLKNEPALLNSLNELDKTDLISALVARPLRNEDADGDHRWNGVIESPEDWNGFVDFLVRARNNLFHGDKGLNSERDLFIVSWGNKILAPLTQTLLMQLQK